MLCIYDQILSEDLINDFERVKELEVHLDINQIYEFYDSILELFE
ncbi:MAG: hypothetical protein ACTSRP_03255 [Candidatus Helarchaeota archaeon]